MGKSVIEWGRGLIASRHPSGVMVYMYYDTPGSYINVLGKPVSEAMAAEAGMDVAKFSKMKARSDKMAAFKEAVEAELELDVTAEQEVVLASKGGYKVVKLALGNARVVDEATEEVLNPKPITEAEAMLLLEHLTADVTGPETETPAAPETKTKGGSNGRASA